MLDKSECISSSRSTDGDVFLGHHTPSSLWNLLSSGYVERRLKHEGGHSSQSYAKVRKVYSFTSMFPNTVMAQYLATENPWRYFYVPHITMSRALIPQYSDGPLAGRSKFVPIPQRWDRLWGPPSLITNGYRGLFPLKREADHSPPPGADVKNGGAILHCPIHYVFMASCLIHYLHYKLISLSFTS
jgi:hypothetical protein